MKKLLLGFAASPFSAAPWSSTDVEARAAGRRPLDRRAAQRHRASCADAGQAGAAAGGSGAAAAPRHRAGERPPGWVPMLGGLALGGLLGWLWAPRHGGLLVGILLVALLVFAGIARRAHADAPGAQPRRPQPMQYAGMGSETVARRRPRSARLRAGRAAARGERARRLRRRPASCAARSSTSCELQIANDQRQARGAARIHHATSCSRS